MSQREDMTDRKEFEAQVGGQNAMMDAAARKLDEIYQNPQFFEKLRQPMVDSDKYDWLEDEMGALFAGSHLISNRSENYRRRARWLNRNRVERKIAQYSPGRLCKGSVRKIAQRVHGRDDKNVREPMLSEDRQQMRLAAEAATAYHLLGIDSTGISAVSEATAVSRVEKSEGESSTVSKASNILK